jgi:hypothetical protein
MDQASLTQWFNVVWARAGGDILIVQTFRNAIMSASVLASATLVTFMGVLAAASHLHKPTALMIGLILAISASGAILSIVQFSRLGFSMQLGTIDSAHIAKRLLFGLRLIQLSAGLLICALLLAAILFI